MRFAQKPVLNLTKAFFLEFSLTYVEKTLGIDSVPICIIYTHMYIVFREPVMRLTLRERINPL